MTTNKKTTTNKTKTKTPRHARIRLARQALGLSQADVAARMHLTQTTISKVERGAMTGDVMMEVERWLAGSRPATCPYCGK